MSRREEGRILLTGATGYVGGRLLPRLEQTGRPVRCLARRPDLLGRELCSRTEALSGDLLDLASIRRAMEAVDTAYYLVHSMGSSRDFRADERRSARNFALAAKEAGVRRIVYLGGLGKDQGLSPHLASRHEVGRLLLGSGSQVLEFRASVVIGSGSVSFEMVRSLVERLPVMITPRWVRVRAQPIAIEDLLDYLVQALDAPGQDSAVYEIGGRDIVAYEDIMREYARQRGLKRTIVPVPFLTPWLSSLWLGLVTPVYARIGRRLFTSLRHETVVSDLMALRDFTVRPRGLSAAIARALANEDREFAQTHWHDTLHSKAAAGRTRSGSLRYVESRSVPVAAPVGAAFAAASEVGGPYGWHAADWLWNLRGAIDLAIGGVGMRRGRPAGRGLRRGDPLDFWRVEAHEPGRRLRLLAEMRLPGRAWLELEASPEGAASRVSVTAIFEPLGLPGILYWYALHPVHARLFDAMLASIARKAESKVRRKDGDHPGLAAA